MKQPNVMFRAIPREGQHNGCVCSVLYCRIPGELLPQLDRVKDPQVFLHLARGVDAFATLNYSKTKRISAVDVERHLRSTGVLCPCNDFFASNSEEMASLG